MGTPKVFADFGGTLSALPWIVRHVAEEPKSLQQAYYGRFRKSGCLMQMLNTVDALAVQLFQKREGASNRLDGGSRTHVRPPQHAV
jgi:hypothetical protein